jgi:ATP-binding cassette subfamily B protein/ATP-binding cassette subfamily C protein
MKILSLTSLDLDSIRARLKSASGVFRQVPGTFRLVWRADRRSALSMAALTLVSAALPAAIAYVGKLIVDAVVTAARTGAAADRRQALLYVVLELLLMLGSTTANRGLAFLRELMRATLGNVVNVQILEKALSLELRHFEDADVYDKMQNARREASSRPLSLVLQVFAIAQNAISLAAYAVLLIRLSPWSVLVLVAASIPAFISETRLAAESFRLN